LAIVKDGLQIIFICFMLGLFLTRLDAQTPFSIYTSPDHVILGTKSGFTDIVTVSVLAGEGFNGTVTISVSGVPEGVITKLGAPGSYLTSLSTFTTYLQLTSSSSARWGNYTLTIAATSQRASSFYAVVNQINLVIQEVGQPHLTSLSSTTEEGVSQPLNIALGIVAGLIVGSVATIGLTRWKGKRH
jgi:hypothetical protein